MNAVNFSNNVKVLFLWFCLLKGRVEIWSNAIVTREISTNPLAESTKKSSFVLFKSSALSTVESWGKCRVFCWENSPWTKKMNANVELTNVLVHTKYGSVETDDITNFVADGEIFETLCVNNNCCEVVISCFTALWVKGWIDNFKGADILILWNLMGEGCINDNSVNVMGVRGSEWNFVEFSVLIFLSFSFSSWCTLGWSWGFFSSARSWHC